MQVVLVGGKSLLEIAPIVHTVTSSVKSIFGIMDSISTSKTPGIGKKTVYSDIDDFLDEVDLRTKLDTYSLLILEIPCTRSKAITNCLINVRNVIKEIEKQMVNIKKKTMYNKSLWLLKSMRAYSINTEFKILQRYIEKLDSRIDRLKTVTEMSKLYNGKVFDASLDISDMANGDDDYKDGESIVHNGILLQEISFDDNIKTCDL